MLSTCSKIVRTALYDVINHDAIDKDGSRNFVRAGRPGPLVNTANRIFPSSPFFLFLAVGLKCCARFGDLRISSLRNDPRGTGLIKPYATLSKEL